MPGEFFGVPTSSVMMVAAHPGDLDSAKAQGLHTAYVHRPHELGPAAKPPAMPEAGRLISWQRISTILRRSSVCRRSVDTSRLMR